MSNWLLDLIGLGDKKKKVEEEKAVEVPYQNKDKNVTKAPWLRDAITQSDKIVEDLKKKQAELDTAWQLKEQDGKKVITFVDPLKDTQHVRKISRLLLIAIQPHPACPSESH